MRGELKIRQTEAKKTLPVNFSGKKGRAYLPAMTQDLSMIDQHHLQNGGMVFVTTVTKNRRPIFSNPAFAREAIDILYRVQELHPFFLHGFIMMPDHCHLLITTDKHSSLSKIIGRFKCGVAHGLGLGPIWQRRFDAKTPYSGSKALHYIHMNPVKAGLVESSEDYPWSSASGKWDVTELDWWF